MGLHRPGSKRGLTRRQSAALQDRWDREELRAKLEELQAKLAKKEKRKRRR